MGIENDIADLGMRVGALERRINGDGGLKDNIRTLAIRIADHKEEAASGYRDLSRRIDGIEATVDAKPCASVPPTPEPVEPGHEYDGVWRHKHGFRIVGGEHAIYVEPYIAQVARTLIDRGSLIRAELPPEIANALAGAGRGKGCRPADVEVARQGVIDAARKLKERYFDGTQHPTWAFFDMQPKMAAVADAMEKLAIAEKAEAGK